MKLRLPICLIASFLLALPSSAQSPGSRATSTSVESIISAMIDASRAGSENIALLGGLYGLGCDTESLGKFDELDELLSQPESFELGALLGKVLSLYPGLGEEMIASDPARARKFALVALSTHPLRFANRARELISAGDPGTLAVIAAAAGCALHRLWKKPGGMSSFGLKNNLADIARQAERRLERKVPKDQCGRNSPVLAGLIENRITPSGRGSINGVQWIHAVGEDGIRYMFSPACACSLYEAAAARRRYFPRLLFWLLDADGVAAKECKTAKHLLAKDRRHYGKRERRAAAAELAAGRGEKVDFIELLWKRPTFPGGTDESIYPPADCIRCSYLWALSFTRRILPDSLPAVVKLDSLRKAVADLDDPLKAKQAEKIIQDAGSKGLDQLIRSTRTGEQSLVLSKALRGAGCKSGLIGPVAGTVHERTRPLPYKAGFQIGRMLADDPKLRKKLLASDDEFSQKLAWVSLVADPRLFCEHFKKTFAKYGNRDADVIRSGLVCIRRRLKPEDADLKKELNNVDRMLTSATFKFISEKDCRQPEKISKRFLPGLLDGSLQLSGWSGGEKHFEIQFTTRDHVDMLIAAKCVLGIYRAAVRRGRYYPELILPIVSHSSGDSARLIESLKLLLGDYPKFNRTMRSKLIELLVELTVKNPDHIPACRGCTTPATRKAMIKDARSSQRGSLGKLFDRWKN